MLPIITHTFVLTRLALHYLRIVVSLRVYRRLAAAHETSLLQVHGSGTTNPSKCIWMLQQQMEQRSKIPMRLTYRGIGSGGGFFEFLGVNNTGAFNYTPYNDFASADIPLSTEDYNALKDKGIEMVHLPFVVGSVGVFYQDLISSDDIVEEYDSKEPPTVNLTACNLAKIFKRNITSWNDPEIVKNNPSINEILPADHSAPIYVARRVNGSSSTASLTEYLNLACPEEWLESMVGSVIEWPADTMECEGSAAMSQCLVDTPGAIGYMESGHGWAENFTEVELENKAGRFLTSLESSEKGAIVDAVVDIPDSADADFGSVNLLNKVRDDC